MMDLPVIGEWAIEHNGTGRHRDEIDCLPSRESRGLRGPTAHRSPHAVRQLEVLAVGFGSRPACDARARAGCPDCPHWSPETAALGRSFPRLDNRVQRFA
jgi:hypothetical protein